MLVADDYTRTTFTELTRTASLPITATDPCTDTTLDSFTIDDVSLSVDGGQETRPFANIADEKSRLNGNQDGVTFCGARTYSIVDSGQYDFLIYS